MQVLCKRYASALQAVCKMMPRKAKKRKEKQSKENKNKQNKIFPHFSNLTFLGIYIFRV